MKEVLQFALLGLGLGSLYSLAGQGLIVIYRGSGVLNFAHGAVGMVGAFVAYEIQVVHGQSFWLAMVGGVLASSALGGLMQVVIMRPLRNVSSLARVVSTLGVLVFLTGMAVHRYGSYPRFLQTALPKEVVHPFGIAISEDRLYLLLIAAVLSLGLWALYRFTRFGYATSAVAENYRTAASVGLSGDRIALTNWMIGSGLAGLSAILIVPIVTLQVTTVTNLVLAALAAALVAGFQSFPVAFAAGIAMGIGQSELTNYNQTPGLANSLPFIVIVLVLLVRGHSLPLRDFLFDRLPSIGTGRLRWGWLSTFVVAAVVIIALVPPAWTDAISITVATAIILLSVNVITGYAGQLSLAQFAIAGFGALIAGRLVASAGWSFVPALVVAVVATAPLGALFAVPALRTRGINLAIVTYGLGTAIQLMVFNNAKFVGTAGGITLGTPSLFGLNIDSVTHGARYCYVALGVMLLAIVAVANLRRGRTGRRLLAARANERAAAALGVSVLGAKIYAFALAAAIAASGGVLLAFRNDSVQYSTLFPNQTSIDYVGYAFLGGIGYLAGPFVGAANFVPGALGNAATNQWLEGLTPWLQIIGGLSIVFIVITNQNGLAEEVGKQMAWLRNRMPLVRSRPGSRSETPRIVLPTVAGPRERVREQVLEVRGLGVRYGGVVALADVSFDVEPGRVTGLIGPNGAGKTTAIDAITGFTPLASGTVSLDGRNLARQSVTKRSRLGVSRSFQALELFEDLSVLDNLRAAADPRDLASYALDLVWPRNPPLPSVVVAAIREFGLEDFLLRTAKDLSYGQRRLLALARALATKPSVLLLDEPAAGLDDAETRELAHLVRRLADDWGIAVLLVEHDMNFVMSICDQIVVLDFGRQISDGDPDHVRNDPTVIAAYLGEPLDDSSHASAERARTTPSQLSGAGRTSEL